MHISISSFLSISDVDFEIKKGLNLLIGKNGSGKTQLLIALAQKNTDYTILEGLGYEVDSVRWNEISNNISINPIPDVVLFREAIRKLNDGYKQNHYVTINPITSFLNIDNLSSGYIYNVQNRFINAYAILGNLYMGGNLKDSTPKNIDNWNVITTKFKEVFSKEIVGVFDSNKGTKLGIKLPSGNIASVNALSTGEIEFLSLISDLIIEMDNEKKNELILIDELDSHFHPDLQKKVINSIKDLCVNKYVLITSHSPAVMQSMELDRIFYIKKSDECKENKNQIISISNEFELNEKLIELYDMFFDNIAITKIMNDCNLKSFYKFVTECELESVALGNEYAKESEPQTVTLRALIQDITLTGKVSIFDVGCGKGRTYPMFKGLDETSLKNIDFYAIDRDENALKEYIYVLQSEDLYNKFATIQAKTKCPKDSFADLILLINVFHEISENLCEIINSCFKSSKAGTKFIICEVGELDLGEMNYIMFRKKSLKQLFKRLIDVDKINVSVTEFSSYKGAKLMNAVIHIKNIDNLFITEEDLISALQNNIDIDTKQLCQNSSNGKSRAFLVNNLANAVCLVSKMQKDIKPII